MNELRRAQNFFMTSNMYKVIQVFPKDIRKLIMSKVLSKYMDLKYLYI